MALPVIPFVAGAIFGGLGVYHFRNEKLRGVVGRTTSSLAGNAKKTAGDASDDVSEGSIGQREENASKSDEEPTSKRKAARK